MYQALSTFFWNKKYVLLFLSIFLIVLTQRFLNDKQNGLINSVASDGTGYYVYLPAAIIYQDFTYKFLVTPENKINSFYNPFPTELSNGAQPLNKYYCGTSLCLLPFFISGVLISAVAGTDINGYTATFLMLVSIASIIYFLLATFLITRIALFFKVSEKLGFFISLLFFLSTNLFHYIVQEPSMSHSYSFFGVTLFFYLLTKLIKNITKKNIVLLSLSLVLVTLIRPPNIVVVLFIPFFFMNLKECGLFFKTLFTQYRVGLLYGIIAFIAGVFLQLLLYYFQTGKFIVESYPGETFNFSHPEVFNILFSYKKGLFLYTPILFFTLAFILIGKSFWYKRFIFIITFSVFLYITSSWWCWYYGGGLSGRPFVDIYPLFILVLIWLINPFSLSTKKKIAVLCIPFVFVNQLMAYQYSHLIMDSGNMEKHRYWDIFLKTDLATINNDRIQSILTNDSVLKTDSMTFEKLDFSSIIVNEGYNSKKSANVGKHNVYSPAFVFSANDAGLTAGQPFYIIAECMAKTKVEGGRLNLIVSVFEDATVFKWEAVFIQQFKKEKNGWRKMVLVARIKEWELSDKKVVKIFLMSDVGLNLVDNIKYSIVQSSDTND